MYRSMMRERLGKYAVKVLGYCITSNHIHAVVTAPNRYGLASFMQSLAGDFAQAYNIRKKKSGAFWGIATMPVRSKAASICETA